MKLYTAVVEEIKTQKTFSAYQITKELRDKVNNSSIVVEDTTQITLPNGDNVTEIPHREVNDIVKDLYDKQVLPLNRTQGLGYFKYELKNQSLGYITPPAALKRSPAGTTTGTIKAKIKVYVDNKKKSNESITLRGIHSSVKTKGTKIKDIITFCGEIGYKVVIKTPTYKSEVE